MLLFKTPQRSSVRISKDGGCSHSKKEANKVLESICLSFTDIMRHVEAFSRFEYNVDGNCYGIPDGKRGKFRPSSDAFKSERKYHILEATH